MEVSRALPVRLHELRNLSNPLMPQSFNSQSNRSPRRQGETETRSSKCVPVRTIRFLGAGRGRFEKYFLPFGLR